MSEPARWARITTPGVVNAEARVLWSVTVIRPMLDYYLTLHDAETAEDCSEDNLVYKIDSGWKIGENVPPPPEARVKPPSQDPLAGDANSTGKSVMLRIPLTRGLMCGACGADGEFIVVISTGGWLEAHQGG